MGRRKDKAVELIARRLKLRELSRLHGAEFVERASHVSAANLDDIWSESEEERRLHAGYARREVAFGPDTGAGSANAKCYPLTL